MGASEGNTTLHRWGSGGGISAGDYGLDQTSRERVAEISGCGGHETGHVGEYETEKLPTESMVLVSVAVIKGETQGSDRLC